MNKVYYIHHCSIRHCGGNITRNGIIEFPFQLTEEGKLEPDSPPESFELNQPAKGKRSTKKTTKK